MQQQSQLQIQIPQAKPLRAEQEIQGIMSVFALIKKSVTEHFIPTGTAVLSLLLH